MFVFDFTKIHFNLAKSWLSYKLKIKIKYKKCL